MIRRCAVLFSVLLAWSAPVLAADPPPPAQAPSSTPGGTTSPAPAPPPADSSSDDLLLPVETPTAVAPAPTPHVPAVVATAAPVALEGAGEAAAAHEDPKSIRDPNTPMLVGMTMFTLSYLPCLAVGAEDDGDAAVLVLPLGGPWIFAATAPMEDWGRVFLGALGGAQVLGAGIFAVGALLPSSPFKPSATAEKRTVSIRAAPVVGPSTWGLSVQGAF